MWGTKLFTCTVIGMSRFTDVYLQNVSCWFTFIDESQSAMQHCQADIQKASRTTLVLPDSLDRMTQQTIQCQWLGAASTNFGKSTLDGHSICLHFHLLSSRSAWASGCGTASQTLSCPLLPCLPCSETRPGFRISLLYRYWKAYFQFPSLFLFHLIACGWWIIVALSPWSAKFSPLTSISIKNPYLTWHRWHCWYWPRSTSGSSGRSRAPWRAGAAWCRGPSTSTRCSLYECYRLFHLLWDLGRVDLSSRFCQIPVCHWTDGGTVIFIQPKPFLRDCDK